LIRLVCAAKAGALFCSSLASAQGHPVL